MKKIILLTIACVILMGSVAAASDMERLAMEMTRINSRIEARIISSGPSDYDSILQALIQENPNSIVRAYPIYGMYTGNASILLACSQDKTQGLLLDISCTPQFDQHLWQQGNLPCQIPLEAQNACK